MIRIITSLTPFRWLRGGRKYRIGGKVYIQRPLVLAQVEQLVTLLTGVVLPLGASPLDIVRLLGSNLSAALAIVLTPRGLDPRDKDLDALAEELRHTVDLETAGAVVADFFTCNRPDFLFEKLTGIMDQLHQRRAGAGSPTSSASSPEATSPGAMPSAGDTPSPSASPTSSTGDGS